VRLSASASFCLICVHQILVKNAEK
jgi:hypothetical protein